MNEFVLSRLCPEDQNQNLCCWKCYAKESSFLRSHDMVKSIKPRFKRAILVLQRYILFFSFSILFLQTDKYLFSETRNEERMKQSGTVALFPLLPSFLFWSMASCPRNAAFRNMVYFSNRVKKR